MADNCIFCKIARGEIPATIVYQDERVVAFRDINPGAPVHILIIPREHIASAAEIDASNAALVGYLLQIAAQIAKQENLVDSGYRVVTNIGADAGQSVPHMHFHVLGGRQMAWPPG
ncbi:MAG: histidine triad nucleotide-binding protein [Anaerolineae bacterium]|nr:histidine triad nucleotide-binding protein [Anaerolineae bacterium]